MMLSAAFLVMLFTTFYHGYSSANGIDRESVRVRRGYATPADIADLSRELRYMQKSIDTITDTLRGLQEKLPATTDQRKPAVDWHEKLQAFDRKLDAIQRSHEEHESYSNKLTALEFTLNHVLSKVVYLSDNIQIRTEDSDPSSQKSNPKTAANIEILARLNDLLRHVRNIKRDNCRRSMLPAAAGPVITTTSSEKPFKHAASSNDCTSSNNVTSSAEELVKQIVKALNTGIFAPLQDLPTITKQHNDELVEIARFVKGIDKRLELWSSEDFQQQNWQRMWQYCQDVSSEFSSFAGNSDALLKRIESFLRDMAQRISESSNRRKSSSVACAERNANDANDSGFNESTTNSTGGFDDNDAEIVPNKADCHELTDDGLTDGIYRFGTPDLNIAGRDFNTRFCTFATDERAWTVIQRRGPYDIQENFNRSWIEYRDGFGDLSKDFWFGNDFIHRLTSYNNYELLIELENFDGGKMSISYGSFGLDSERNNFSLFIGDYKGPGPDSLSYHCFMDFSTYDHSNKENDSCCTCAIGYGSGWWFDNCLEANLNGIYRREPLNHTYVGIIWEHWLGDYSLKATRMLVRPKNWTLLSDGDKSGVKWLEP